MMSLSNPASATTTTPLRMESPVPFKKRKTVRRRALEEAEDDQGAAPSGPLSGDGTPDQVDDAANATRQSTLPKQRAQNTSRKGGVGFSSNATPRSDLSSSSELIRHRPQDDAVTLAASRFVGSTGHSFAVEDKHM